jgi:hypothetical protein
MYRLQGKFFPIQPPVHVCKVKASPTLEGVNERES